nr:MerR family transcriptional regulator [uncultured Flavonifractor sp.]
MNSFFSVGELSKLQNISRQTLIFYDKIGLFQPAYVDPDNGYRYYSSSQLDALDTILLMKKMGLSLDEIRVYMQDYTADSSILAMKRQLSVLTSQIEELQMLKSRVEHRCAQLEHARDVREWGERVTLEQVKRRYLLTQAVEPPYTLEQTSLATKQCFVRAFREHIPVFSRAARSSPMKTCCQGGTPRPRRSFSPSKRAGTRRM